MYRQVTKNIVRVHPDKWGRITEYSHCTGEDDLPVPETVRVHPHRWDRITQDYDSTFRQVKKNLPEIVTVHLEGLDLPKIFTVHPDRGGGWLTQDSDCTSRQVSKIYLRLWLYI